MVRKYKTIYQISPDAFQITHTTQKKTNGLAMFGIHCNYQLKYIRQQSHEIFCHLQFQVLKVRVLIFINYQQNIHWFLFKIIYLMKYVLVCSIFCLLFVEKTWKNLQNTLQRIFSFYYQVTELISFTSSVCVKLLVMTKFQCQNHPILFKIAEAKVFRNLKLFSYQKKIYFFLLSLATVFLSYLYLSNYKKN